MATTEILLSSATFIKSVTNISDNVAGKFLLPSLREAQEVGLRGIVGDCLLAKLKELAATDPDTHTRPIDEAENAPYKDLVEKAQYYLAFSTLVDLCNRVTYKVANFGVAKTSDEKAQAALSDGNTGLPSLEELTAELAKEEAGEESPTEEKED